MKPIRCRHCKKRLDSVVATIACRNKQGLRCRKCDTFHGPKRLRKLLGLKLPPKPAVQDRIQAAFDEFDAKHPEIYELFEETAEKLIEAGHTYYSSDSILHHLRIRHDLNRNRDAGFKLNNNFSSRYARKFMALHPRFDGFFKTRKLARQS